LLLPLLAPVRRVDGVLAGLRLLVAVERFCDC